MLKRLFKFGGDTNFGTPALIGITAIGFLLILCLWQLVCTLGIVPVKVLPAPLDVIKSIPALVTDNHLFGNLMFTLRLNWEAYFFALLISFPVAFTVALFPCIDIVIGRYMSALRFTPLPSVTACFIAIYGLTINCKVAFLTAGIVIFMIPEIINRIYDLQNPKNPKDNVLLQTAQTLGMMNWQKLRYVYFPYVTGNVYTSIVSLMGISFSYCVISELIYKDGDVSGVGSLINTMIRQSYMPEAYALIFLIIFVGFIQDWLLMRLGKVLFPYKK